MDRSLTNAYSRQQAQQPLIREAEICHAYYYLVSSAIADATARGLIVDQGTSGVGADGSLVGPTLCLYHTAQRSDITLPNVRLPDFPDGGGSKWLHRFTCPLRFMDLFSRWSGVIGQIQELSRSEQDELEQIICNQCTFPYANPTSVHNIANYLRSIAAGIRRYRSYTSRDPVANTPPVVTTPMSLEPSPPVAMPLTSHETSYPAPTPPRRSTSPRPSPPLLPRTSPRDGPNLGLPTSLVSQDSNIGWSAAASPGSGNEQDEFIGDLVQRRRSTSPSPAPKAARISPPFTEHTTEYDAHTWSERSHKIVQFDGSTPTRRRVAPTPLNLGTPDLIASYMHVRDVVEILSRHGCRNLTDELNPAFLEGPLSRGGFGEVYVAILEGGAKVAVKKIFTPCVRPGEKKRFFKHVAHEAYAWSKCIHRNVAHLLGVAVLNGEIAMLSLWMENGDLRTYLNENPQADRLGLCTNIADGLTYLHGMNFIHGDLKGPNVLISKEGRAIITDFGNAGLEEASLRFTETSTDQRYTIRWAAPEILDDGKLSFEADVYALGMTLLEALTGEIPYSELKNNPAVITTVLVKKHPPLRSQKHFPVDDERSDALWALMLSCWKHEPGERPTASHVLGKFCSITHRETPRLPKTARDALSGIHDINDTTGPTQILEVIGSNISLSDIITYLGQHGCHDISRRLDLSSCSPRPVSRSGFSDTYFGRLDDGTPVAIKTIFTCSDGEDPEHKDLKRIAWELYTWSRCQHPNVANLLGLAEFRDRIAMVSAWMENGDLRTYLKKYPYVDRFDLCVQIADGLAYLHSIRIVHGDLKGPNVLVSREGTATLIDFGNAALGETTLQFTQTATRTSLTARWAAPEIFNGAKHDAAADIYALGMTILEAFTGRVPYAGKTDPAVMSAVLNDKKAPDRPQEIPEHTAWGDELWGLLLNCWCHIPSERPTARDVRQHLQKLRHISKEAYAPGASGYGQ